MDTGSPKPKKNFGFSCLFSKNRIFWIVYFVESHYLYTPHYLYNSSNPRIVYSSNNTQSERQRETQRERERELRFFEVEKNCRRMSELDHAHDTGNTPVIRRLLDDTVCEVRDDVFFFQFYDFLETHK